MDGQRVPCDGELYYRGINIEELTKGKKVMRTILLIPWIIPGVISALMWKWMLQADVGIINYILMELNITDQNILFLSDVNITLFVLILINVWKATPFWFLMITLSKSVSCCGVYHVALRAQKLFLIGNMEVVFQYLLHRLRGVA